MACDCLIVGEVTCTGDSDSWRRGCGVFGVLWCLLFEVVEVRDEKGGWREGKGIR